LGRRHSRCPATIFRIEIDRAVRTAMLTVIARVTNDRRLRPIRENGRGTPASRSRDRQPLDPPEFARSIHDELHRRPDPALALPVRGGHRNFVLALLIGIISGPYSSIFNASPLLVVGTSGRTAGSVAPVRRAPRETRRVVSDIAPDQCDVGAGVKFAVQVR